MSQHRRFMETGEALERVYQLACEALNSKDQEGNCTIAERDADQLALDTVHDFIVNNFESEE